MIWSLNNVIWTAVNALQASDTDLMSEFKRPPLPVPWWLGLPAVRSIPRVRPRGFAPKQLRPMHTFTSRPRTFQYQISASKVNNSSYKPPTVSETVSRSFAPAMIRTTGAWFIRPRFLNFPKIFKKIQKKIKTSWI